MSTGSSTQRAAGPTAPRPGDADAATASLRTTVSEFLNARVTGPADADRESAAQRIGRGYAEGRITVAEFDERIAALWRTATYAELGALIADMPDGPAAPQRPQPRSHPDRQVLRLITAGWLAISVINFVVWALICIIGFRWESPWWLWSFAPPGVLLAGAWWVTDPKRRVADRLGL